LFFGDLGQAAQESPAAGELFGDVTDLGFEVSALT
jgi:hypothetical protein